MQNPETGEMTPLPLPGQSLDESLKTAARQGFPVWEVGERIIIKGIAWRLRTINAKSRQLTLEYVEKAAGIAAMMTRIQKLADKAGKEGK